MTRARKQVGRITFVGAGPGDPELLVLAAREALRSAQSVYADSGIPSSIIALATDAQVQVSDAFGADVAKLLLADARAGLRVVRAVTGDVLES
ncbi:MAG: bifunctional uroporphyrinogen-III C-methyltransferase/uroporphyrinogen-III synthase, partial [Actinobacteria bacterium]|nr:bifunctional uroporphyrinogen-III C-methyltransferase/uroporphyrinogen-III synthase [Actinomycetota bacterium]